jgi:hypothetical protein
MVVQKVQRIPVLCHERRTAQRAQKSETGKGNVMPKGVGYGSKKKATKKPKRNKRSKMK